jgi:hypothetical protein
MPRACFAVLAFASIVVASGCSGIGEGFLAAPKPKQERAACPDIGPGRLVLGSQFISSGPIDTKVKAYVQASNDLGAVASQAEMEIAQACTRIGIDLGVPGNAMQPRQENGGRANGACYPAANALDNLNQQGAAVWVRVTPPFCTPNQLALNQCSQTCAANPGDLECAASCKAHGDIYGTCSPALIVVTPSNPNPLSFRLAGTLQANLPALIHGQFALARRLVVTGQALNQIGQNLNMQVNQAGAVAQGCVADGTNQVQTASWLLQISERAASQVSGRVGANGG